MRRSFNPLEKFILADRSNWKCSICGCDLPKDWHADHIKPVSKGGRTWLSNGQALCPQCNLKKGDKMETEKTSDKPLRPWQTEALLTYSKLRKDSKKIDYLFQATPGAGKTRLAIELVKYEMERLGQKPFCLIVSPTSGLRVQWAEEMINAGFKVSENHKTIRDEMDGLAITYQIIKTQSNSLNSLVREKKPIVIFDEIHHLSDDNIWGLNAGYAFNSAPLRIGLTGTPFRSDNHPIKFVDYDPDTSICIPDYKLSYAEALKYRGKHKMVRSISFPYFEGHMSWINESGHNEATFDTCLNDKQSRERLLTALNPRHNLFSEMFCSANKKLDEIRGNGFRNAGGLVFCLNQQHARAVSEYIKQTTGEATALVISEEEDALPALKDFKNSDSKWLISCKQVTEGVDIPRAIVAVYATNITTPTFFWQVVFRVGRYINDPKIKNSVAHVFLPKHEDFIQYARDILKDVNLYAASIKPEDIPQDIDDLEDDWIEDRDRRDNIRNMFLPLSATGEEAGQIYDGDDYATSEISYAKTIMGSTPGAEGYDPVIVAQILSKAKLTQETTRAKTEKQKTYDEQIKDKREEIDVVVKAVARQLSEIYKEDMVTFIISINSYLKNTYGDREDLGLKRLHELQVFMAQKAQEFRWWKRTLRHV